MQGHNARTAPRKRSATSLDADTDEHADAYASDHTQAAHTQDHQASPPAPKRQRTTLLGAFLGRFVSACSETFRGAFSGRAAESSPDESSATAGAAELAPQDPPEVDASLAFAMSEDGSASDEVADEAAAADVEEQPSEVRHSVAKRDVGSCQAGDCVRMSNSVC